MASNRCTTGSLAFLMAVTAGLLDTGTADAQPASSGDAITVNQKYTAPASDKDGKARGISGIACLGKSGDKGSGDTAAGNKAADKGIEKKVPIAGHGQTPRRVHGRT